MVMSIAPSKLKHRFDSSSPPILTIGGWADFPGLMFKNHLYQTRPVSPSNPFTWAAPNKTDAVEISLRDLTFGGWTLSSGISRNSGTNQFTKSAGGDGFAGALGNALPNASLSIEGKPDSFNSTVMFALQSGTPTDFNFFSSSAIEHALIISQTGFAQVYEKGVAKENTITKWNLGDKALIELASGIVRYYKISSLGVPTLIRSTRSKLVGTINPTLMIYSVGGSLSEVAVWYGPEAKTQMQIYGVLENFQDWQNKASWESLADRTVNKDKSEEFTYFSTRKYLKSLSINVAWDEGDQYRKFVEFYKWHDASREFIFKDAARGDEFFARFVSPFSDSPLGADTFGMAADIRQIISAPGLDALLEPMPIAPPVQYALVDSDGFILTDTDGSVLTVYN